MKGLGNETISKIDIVSLKPKDQDCIVILLWWIPFPAKCILEMRQTGSSFSQASRSSLDEHNLCHPSENKSWAKCTNNHKLQNKETNILITEGWKWELNIIYLKVQCKASSSWNQLLRIRLLSYGIWASIYLSFPNILLIGSWTLCWDNHLQTTQKIYIHT